MPFCFQLESVVFFIADQILCERSLFGGHLFDMHARAHAPVLVGVASASTGCFGGRLRSCAHTSGISGSLIG